MSRELAKGTAASLILRIVADTPQHGYGVLQAIRERSGNLLDFTEGTIYPVLHSLEADGLVSSQWESLQSGRRRKIYQLTPQGATRLKESTEEWQRFREAVDAILDPGQGVPNLV